MTDADLSGPQADLVDRLTRPDSPLAMSERQAQAFVLREIEDVSRPAAAAAMGISTNTLDNRLAEARDKWQAAQWTVKVVKEAAPEIPAP